MRLLVFVFATAFFAVSAGCVAHVDSRHSSGHGRTVVVVGAGHTCFDSCDHFELDGVWYIETGHRHRSGCGHFLSGGRWIVHKSDGKPGQGPPPKNKPDKGGDHDNRDGDKHDNKGKDKGGDHDNRDRDKDKHDDKGKEKHDDKDKDKGKDKDKDKDKGKDKDKDKDD